MKVALLSYGFPEYCIQQANGLARECDVLLILPRAEAAEYQHLLDPAVQLCLFDKPRLRQPVRQLSVNARLLRKIHQFQPDVIHFQQGHLWFNFALPILRKYPLVITIHDPRHHAGDRDSRRTPQRMMDFGFRQADRVIVHGEALKRDVVDAVGIPQEMVHVIPHVAIGCMAVPNEPSDDGATILFFGRIWAYKGLEYLINAEPHIRRHVPHARIVIAGKGEEFGKYRALMERPEAFEVHNRYIGAGESEKMFQRASVVVLPYTEATQSGVIPLAYSYAKPVVATRVGALADAVENGVTGVLVPPSDEAALAGAVVEVLHDPERRRAMGLAGREKLDREWSPAAVGRQALDVYRRAIEQRSREAPSPVVAGCIPVDSRDFHAVEGAAKQTG